VRFTRDQKNQQQQHAAFTHILPLDSSNVNSLE
jgi:hypothetical protein